MDRSPGIDELATAWGWVLRLREDQASAEDLAAWLQWYEADERHKQAFEEMQALWHGAGELDVETLSGVSRACPDTARAVRASARRAPKWMGIAFALAASVVALALVIGEWRSLGPHRTQPTAVVRETQLSDGSRVELASRSIVTAHYTEKERVLDMQGTAGEAYFSVARNSSRPFIVKVGTMRVRALGTAFNIRRANERVVVTVTEGLVEIYSPDGTGDAAMTRMRLAAGQRMTLDLGSRRAKVTSADAGNALAWQQGKLEYLNEPLTSVVADVNRYTRRRVEIGDEAAGRILVTGTVFTHDVDGWIEALPRVFPVTLSDRDDGTLLLRRRER